MNKGNEQSKPKTAFLFVVALSAWMIPGGGYYLLGEKKRATVVFAAIVLTFCIGIYVGSIGVIDPVGAVHWYLAQMLNSPLVAVLGYVSASGAYPVYGKPSEIGQIYTSISGLLNLLCIVNSVYMAYKLSAAKET